MRRRDDPLLLGVIAELAVSNVFTWSLRLLTVWPPLGEYPPANKPLPSVTHKPSRRSLPHGTGRMISLRLALGSLVGAGAQRPPDLRPIDVVNRTYFDTHWPTEWKVIPHWGPQVSPDSLLITQSPLPGEADQPRA
ncbi:Hypothetical protein CINCED_3A005188 [Cinara cedri]|uniref:Uncharacterized protein n=1 Tax=Cinara cedri TaxID=506608 RepID=A0A5E4N0A5_9HEMI|nr:Hypothetical protein CINCED_3A005188 [Cinara cedri]